MCQGTHIAGFPKGKWVQHKSTLAAIPDKNVPFLLENCDTLILMNGATISISDWLASLQEKMKPDVEPFKYYKRVSTPVVGKPDKFALERTHLVCYNMADVPESEKGFQATTIGSTMPWSSWNTKATQIIWTLRLAAKGALPIRPSIVASTAVRIPAQQCLLLK